MLSDGSSDRVLLPVINWTLRENTFEDTLVQQEWANTYYSGKKLNSLIEKINYAIENYPCDILFVHRDTESSLEHDFKNRQQEVATAWTNSVKYNLNNKMIPVIPIRMTEAWLLINESAIRMASGNPNGKIELSMPEIRNVESLPNPKKDLMQFIRIASDLRKRNLRKLNLRQAIYRVAENISDYSSLRRLNAFQVFEKNLIKVLSEMKLLKSD